MKKIAIILSLNVFVLVAASQTQRIVFQAPLLYPEGVAYNPSNNLFYVSSVKTGTIGTVDQRGIYNVFYQDNSLKSSFGMKVDTRKNRLWVCVGDPNYSTFSTPATFKKMARVISLDIATGKKINDIDVAKLLPGNHFANDLTFDNNGNLFITDSYSPLIYKIDANAKVSVFVNSDKFKGEDVGLNGIVYHPMGYLLVAYPRGGSIYKIDAKDPQKITKVKINKFFPGADGLLLDEQNNLILIQNKGVNKAFQLSSNDNWVSAEIVASTAAEDRFQHPTTGTIQNGTVWLLNSKMNEITDSSKTPSKEFSLQLVKFAPAK